MLDTKQKQAPKFPKNWVYKQRVKVAAVSVGIVTLITCWFLAAWFTGNRIKIQETTMYQEQLEARLNKGEVLNDEEQYAICKYFLATDVAKYQKYCVSEYWVLNKFNKLFEQYIQDSTEIDEEDLEYLREETAEFVRVCKDHKSKNTKGHPLLQEIASTLNSYKGDVKYHKYKGKITNTYISQMYARYIFNDIIREITLLKLKEEFIIDNTKIVVDARTVFHIRFRHFEYEGLTDSLPGLLKKYQTIDEALNEVTILLNALENKNKPLSEFAIGKQSSKGIMLYLMFTDGRTWYPLEIGFVKDDKGIYYVKTFYECDPTHNGYQTRLNDLTTTRCSLYKLTEGMYVYRKTY